MALLCAAWLGVVGCTLDNRIVALADGGEAGGESVGDGDGDGDGDGEGGSEGGPTFNYDLGVPDGPMGFTEARIPVTCEEAAAYPGSTGCAFIALDLDQSGLSDHDPWGVAIGNPHPEQLVEVQAEARSGGSWIPLGPPVTIDPEDGILVELPDESLLGPGLFGDGAYRISSDFPVQVMQLSPLQGGQSFSSGAALLHPIESQRSRVHAMGWRTEVGIGESAHLSVVALQDDTAVAIEAPVPTAAGPGVPASGFLELQEFSISEGDVVQLAALDKPMELDYGFTGATVATPHGEPLAVFSSHTCAGIPGYQDGCGHVQEQLSRQLFGKRFVAARHPVRTELVDDPTLWQIRAIEDDTQIVFEGGPDVVGLPPSGLITLDRAESINIWVGGDGPGFEIESDEPIGVFAYHGTPPEGAGNVGGGASMVQLVPVPEYLNHYVLFAPEGWDRTMISIVREPDSAVLVDGQEVSNDLFEPIADFEIGRLLVQPGVHTVETRRPSQVIVDGVRQGDGFAYLGGWGSPRPVQTPAG